VTSHTLTSDCTTCHDHYSFDLLTGIDELVTTYRFRRPQYLLNLVNEIGAVEATRQLVAERQLSDGFTDLALLGLLDRSLEASVLNFTGPCPIFDQVVLASARRKLGR